ncbi:MAG: hypothetical protein ACJAWR_001585, partial [Flavobacteriales bacterium]
MIIKPNLLAQIFCYLGNYKLILENGQLKRDLKTLWFFQRKPKLLNANKIIVFDKELGVFGHKLIAGYKPGGGDNSEIKIAGLNPKKIKEIEAFIKEQGADINNEGEKIKTSFPFRNPRRWFSFREKLILNEKGIGHIKKGWFKTRQSFLPFESINIYCYNGVLNKDVLLEGDTTISLIEKLSNSNNEKLKKILIEKGVNSTKGRKYLPALLSFKRGLSPDILITTKSGLYFKSKKLVGGQKNIFLKYEEITKFKKIGAFKIFAPIMIKGRRVDARAGEGGDVEI